MSRPLLFCLSFGLTLIACGESSSPPPPSPGPMEPIVIATSADLAAVNELVASSSFSHELLANLFLPLFEEQPDFEAHPPTFAPRLATSSEWSDDHRELLVHLRSDADWSDGTPITAADVVWTHEAQTRPEVGWVYAFAKDRIATVEAVDPHTVRFRFTEAYSAQLLDANEGFVLPRHAWAELPWGEWPTAGDWFVEHLVTNGPFTLESWRPQQEIILRRRERQADRPLRVVFRIVPDRGQQLALLEAGEAHFVAGLTPDDRARIEDHPDLEWRELATRQYNFICWNTAREPFSDPSVRVALTLGIDRQELVDTLYGGAARIATSPIPSTVWAHHPDLTPWPHDPEAAAARLAAAGWIDTDGDGIRERNGRPFRFELSTNSGNPLRRDALVLIQAHLRRIGVDAVPRFFDLQTLIDLNQSHDFDATLGAWGIDTSLDVSYAFHSDAVDDASNYGGFRDPEVDRLIDAVGSATELADALPELHRLQEILHREQPYTFLWEPPRFVATSRRLHGAEPTALSTYAHLETWWLAP